MEWARAVHAVVKHATAARLNRSEMKRLLPLTSGGVDGGDDIGTFGGLMADVQTVLEQYTSVGSWNEHIVGPLIATVMNVSSCRDLAYVEQLVPAIGVTLGCLTRLHATGAALAPMIAEDVIAILANVKNTMHLPDGVDWSGHKALIRSLGMQRECPVDDLVEFVDNGSAK